LAGNHAAAETLERLIERHEDDLIAARRAANADAHRVNQIRYTLGWPVRYREATHYVAGAELSTPLNRHRDRRLA
jgi:hypothetical protein